MRDAIHSCSDDGGDTAGASGNGNTNAKPSADLCAREEWTCEQIKADQEAKGKEFGVEVAVELGSWNDVPDTLKVPPPGATLCGSVDPLNQGVFISDLSGAGIVDYCAPIFAALDCPGFACATERRGCDEQYSCQCEVVGGGLGQVVTSPEVESFYVSLVAFK